jgi:hypothetical protein
MVGKNIIEFFEQVNRGGSRDSKARSNFSADTR